MTLVILLKGREIQLVVQIFTTIGSKSWFVNLLRNMLSICQDIPKELFWEQFPGNSQELVLKNFSLEIPKNFHNFGRHFFWLFSRIGNKKSVGRIHNICRSDAQLQQVKCTTLVGRMHNISIRMHNFNRLDAQPFVGRMHIFSMSDAQLQQVGCTTLVGRMHNFSRSDTQLQQVGCTILIGRMHNFCRSDAQFWPVQFIGCDYLL